MKTCLLLLAALVGLAPAAALAQAGRADVAEGRAEARVEEKGSPWLALPTFSIDPKLGTSLGALVGYMHHFDEKSRPSMFGVGGQYTTTDSAIATAFAHTSFDEDRQRLVALVMGGRVKNDYDDYLGTGTPLKSNGEMSAAVVRYLHRVWGNWFAGVQGIYSNYVISGDSVLDQTALDVLGLKGFTSGGIGVAAYYDSRDDERMPTRGWLVNANNTAFRDWIAGSENFDAYRLDTRGFLLHGSRHVFAVRQYNQWTVDAPPSAFASVRLRGYKQGQYLGKNMSSLEAEERLRLAEKWSATAYFGIACLYGDGKSCSDRENTFPAGGVGVQYILKPKDGIVANLEYAAGKAGNYGVYLKLGYGF
jgi:hypothetical protein